MTVGWEPGYGPLLETRASIVTWNVWGRYGPWEARQPAILENLRRIDADIVCLQEAWSDDESSQPASLALSLGYEQVYAPAFEMNGAWSGNAVLSRWPIRASEIVELPMEGGGAVDSDDGERRLAVRAEIDGPRGVIQVFCTHLSWRADWSGVRQEQVRALCRFVEDARPRSFPAVLCGDFNAAPDSDEVRMLTGAAAVPVPGVVFRDSWRAAPSGDAGFTWSNRNPFAAASLDLDARIDYVFVGWPKLGGGGQVTAARVAGDVAVDGCFGSDHLAVVAELRY